MTVDIVYIFLIYLIILKLLTTKPKVLLGFSLDSGPPNTLHVEL